MPLPDRTTAWPPPQMQIPYRAYEEWNAWYAGDPDQLSTIYSMTRLQQQSSIWGQVKRFFWGTPTPTTTSQRPNKLHVPLAGEISRMSAALLFSDLPDIKVWDADDDADDKGLTSATGKAAQSRLTEIVDDRVHATLLEAAEVQSGIGGTFLRVAWDKAVDPDKPFLTTVAPDAAVPTFRWGRLAEVTFWQELASLSGTEGCWRLLENHTPGRIEWGLYLGKSQGELGVRMPLDSHPDAASLASMVDAQSGTPTGSDLLTAAYIPNALPNRRWRKDPAAKNLGRSDYDGVEGIFDALDETYTSWMRDLRLARARIMVDKQLLDARGPGQGATFDADREVFVNFDGTNVGSLNMGAKSGSASGLGIEMFQPLIRLAEHQGTAQGLLERAIAGCGYSASTFGESGDLAITATEANNREKATVLTRGAKLLHWRPALADILSALLDVDQFVFNGPGRGDARPEVEFADAAAESPKIVAETLHLLNTAEAASIKTKVEILHPDWDADQIDAEVVLIKGDYSMMPDPTMAHLWAAEAGNGSATGGVAANRGGVVGSNVDAEATSQGGTGVDSAATA